MKSTSTILRLSEFVTSGMMNNSLKKTKTILLLIAVFLMGCNLNFGQTTQTWQSTASTAWLTAANWNAAVPGSKTVTTNNDIALFNINTATGVGINMTTQTGTHYLGALNFGTGATTNRSVSNSTATAGTVFFNGVTLNGTANTIIWNQSSGTHSFTNGSGTFNLGLNATDHVIQITGAGGVTIASAITGTSKNLEKAGTGAGVLTLSGTNTYSGNTLISAGTLALSTGGSIANSPNITIGSSGTFSVSGLTTALTLATNQVLKASATGSNTTGTLTVSNTKGLTLSATGGLTFTAYGGGATAPLTVSGASAGVLALNGAPINVITTTALTAGTYILIDKALSATGVSGTPGTLTVNGSGIAPSNTAALSVNGSGQLVLTVTSTSTPILAITANSSAAFGSVCTNGSSTKTFTITNTGTAATNVVVSSNNVEYSVGPLSSTSIPGTNGTATFDVTYTPVSGSLGATLTSKYDTITTSGTLGLTGTALAPVSQAVTSIGATSVVNTIATLNGDATFGVCPSTTTKGFVYSKDSENSNPDVTGGLTVTIVTSGSLGSAGAYTAALTGLTPDTLYRFKAYVFDGTTYTYSALQSFTTLKVASKLAFGISPAPPTTGNVGTNLTTFTVLAQRPDDSTDTEYTGTVTLVKGTVSGSANITGNAVGAVAGVATFNATQFDAEGTFNLTATSGSLTNSATSSDIVIILANSTSNPWINTGASTSWCTGANWNTGFVPSTTQVATWNDAGTAIVAGITFSTCIPTVLGIEVTNLRTRALSIGSQASTAGTLTLTGGVINLTPNTIIRNNSAFDLTLQPNNSSSGPMSLTLGNTTNNIVRVDGAGKVIITSVINGGATLPLTKTGAGTLVLGNSANTYSGTTTITTGELRLNPSTTTATFASPVVLNGGTLSTTSITASTTFTSSSTLGLTESSTIALGSNAHSLKFAASNGVSWTAAKTITITGWNGTAGQANTTGNRIFFGNSSSGLTSGQLSQITFQGYTNGTIILSSGEIVPKAPHTVTYNANGGTGTQTDATLYNDGATVTVLGLGSITRTGYTFDHWNTAIDNSGISYSQGNTFTINANVILYAQWNINSYTLTYDSNGGTGTQSDPSSPYNYNTNATVLGIGSVVNPGFNFSTWNTAADGSGVNYNPGSSLLMTANTTLYAKWVSASAPICALSTAVAPDAEQIRCQGFPANALAATITSAGTTGSPSYSYQWYYNTTNDNTTFTHPVGTNSNTFLPPTTGSEGTRYYFVVGYSDNVECGPQTGTSVSLASATVKVIVNANPTAAISVAETSGTTNNDGTICTGASVTLTASGGTSYLWSTTATTAPITVSPTTTTTYTVTVTNAASCSIDVNTSVTVNSLPAKPTISPSGTVSLCFGETTSLMSSSGTSYAWLNGAVASGSTQTISSVGAGSYTVRVTDVNGCQSAASDATTVNVGSALVPGTVDAASTAPNTANHVVISQVYGGGGNASATYKNDFIELYNPTGSSVSLANWKVQYASASGAFGDAATLTGSIAPGQYYLIGLASGGTPGIVLPTTQATGSTNMSATSGKVQLINASSTVIDLFGFGGATTFEGTVAPALSGNVLSYQRKNSGCTDSENNANDFTNTNTANARNTSSPTNSCSIYSETICSGNTSSLINASGVSGSTEPYTYKWYKNDSLTIAPIGSSIPLGWTEVGSGLSFTSGMLTEDATFALYVTATGCGSGTSAWASGYRQVDVNPIPTAPTITPSGTVQIAAGGNVTLTSSAASGNTWSTTETTASIIVNTAGSYTVHVTTNGCVSAESAATVVQIIPAVATTSPATLITTDSATLTGNASAQGQSAITVKGIVYAKTSDIITTLTIGEANVVTLSTSGGTGAFSLPTGLLVPDTGYSFRAYATNSQGTSYGSTVTFTTLKLPTITSVTQQGSGCDGTAAVFEIVGLLPDIPAEITYTTSSGTHTAIFDGNPGNFPIPTAGIGLTQFTSVALSYDNDNGQPLTITSVKRTDINREITVFNPGSNVASITVIQKTTPTFAAINPICYGSASPFSDTSLNGVHGSWAIDVSFLPFDSTIVGDTTYRFTPDTGLCAIEVTRVLTVIALPAVPTVTTTAPTCSANGFSTITNYSASNTYTFSPTGPTAGAGGTITGAVLGTSYTITSTNTGCTSGQSSAFTNAVMLPTPATPTISAGGPTTFCSGGSVVLTSSAASGNTWSTGAVSQSITVSTAGDYTVQVTNGFGCQSLSSAATTVTVIAQLVWYLDADNDGYSSSAASSVSACTQPVGGYKLAGQLANAGVGSIGTDCNDSVATIYPGAAETCYDGILQNCNGSLLSGCAIITSRLRLGDCGANLTSTGQIIRGDRFSQAIPSGVTVTGYRFRVTNTQTGAFRIVERPNYVFQLTYTDIATYSTTYTIEVALRLNQEWMPTYGAACSVTTPGVAQTALTDLACGSHLAQVSSTIRATSVVSASSYDFEVSLIEDDLVTATTVFNSPSPSFNLLQLSSFPIKFGAEYRIRVKAIVLIDSVALPSSYGTTCSVFTPEAPLASLRDCAGEGGLALTSYNTVIYANPLGIGGAQYIFTLYNEDGYSQQYYSYNRYVRLMDFHLLTPLTVGGDYKLQVDAFIYGFPYAGKDCDISVPAPPTPSGKIVVATVFQASAYPNPFANNFMLDVKTSSDSVVNLKVYDMVGRLIEQREARVSDLETTTIGDRYPSGVYNVVVSQEDNVQTLRVVKR
ncbi:InlB B-repeat-containing protein [Flavobacterium sangjuense]|uniref:LTD domain-containing protein n=1 Tax=Flavobacterium sangjuense TaxID=2518177 RepID=A0A4P7PVC9_9FLAO|nr:InlB B-repeat-containing protein [Flavobacterium sangjuense]QBZ97863.1 hypothetical protein GS03_01361 [Flavobacterium sangjuense]